MKPLSEIHVDELLDQVLDVQCDELHLDANAVPRIKGRDAVMLDLPYETLRPAQLERLLYDILSAEQINSLHDNESLLFPYRTVRGDEFSGVIVFRERGMAATFRVEPDRKSEKSGKCDQS